MPLQTTTSAWHTRRVQARFLPATSIPASLSPGIYQRAQPSTAQRPKLLDQVRETIRPYYYQFADRECLCAVDQAIHLFSQ